tara:strand:- start:611 stop:1330 length:720 start_codon:yes stop_codon:yes gene_type:complete
MEKEKKIKSILGIIYVLIISVFLWVFFENYSLNEIASYDFIKNNRDQLIKFKNSNFFLIFIVFFVFSILWILLAGFATPVCLMAGFIFGKWIGLILVSLGLTIGSTLLYIFANYFFRELIKKKFSSRFTSLNEKFKKNEFLFFLVYRFVGGIPFFISNILPTLFNISKFNFFFGTLLGMIPQLFIWVSLGNGLEKIIDQNLNTPSLVQMLLFPDIYIPIIGFIFLLVLGILIKNLFYKT